MTLAEEAGSAQPPGGAATEVPSESRKISPGATGLSAFTAKMISIVTGTVFILMVTRTLTQSQFGFWEIITTVVAFSLYPANLIDFWATRDSARGRATGATALVANLVLSVLGVAFFLAIALLSYGRISVALYPFLVASVMVPIGYWYTTGLAVLYGVRPQRYGYVLLSGEGSKLVVAFVVLYLLKLQIVGVILSLGLSNLVQAMLSTYYVRATFSGGVRLSVARRWLGDSWLPGLNTGAYLVAIADSLVVAIASGSTLVTAYYQAAFVVATVVANSFFLSYALYPMLLRGASEKLVGPLLNVSLMLGIPMAVGASVLAYQILYLVRPAYVASSFVLCILAFSTLTLSVSNFFDNSLMGMDTADLVEKRNLQTYLRSNLFFVSKINLLYGILYVPSVFFLVYFGTMSGWGVEALAEGWAALQITFALATTAIKLSRLGTSSLKGVGRPLLIYTSAALLMGGILYLVAPVVVVYSTDAAVYGIRLLALVVFGGLAYLGILYLADRQSRIILQKVYRLVLRSNVGPGPSTQAISPD
jgi:O-antigen/teichoic acid export membrane protein